MMTETKIRKHYARLMPIYRRLGLALAGDVVQLARLARIEDILHKWAEESCSIPLPDRTVTRRETLTENYLDEVRAMFPLVAPDAIFCNMDPRGFALKIESEDAKKLYASVDDFGKERIERDWGGYGLLSPDAQELHE